MEQKQYNMAQWLLIAIGGSATLVAGYDGHYQTAKKPTRKKISYAQALKSHFDDLRFEEKKQKQKFM